MSENKSPYACPRKTNSSTIAERRIALGITQADLAREMGVSIQTVSDWERKGVIPRRRRLKKLAEVLKCAAGELIDL